MGNEEPAYEVLPRSVLGSDKNADIRKLKTIGTRKHNPVGAEITKHVKDLDASSIHPAMKNT